MSNQIALNNQITMSEKTKSMTIRELIAKPTISRPETPKSLQELFLDYVKDDIFPDNRPKQQCRIFEYRLNPKNKDMANIDLIESLYSQYGESDKDPKDIQHKCQEDRDVFKPQSFNGLLGGVMRKIQTKYKQELIQNGVYKKLEGQKGGHKTGELHPWQHAYNWLWGVKYISWAEEYIWSQWKKAATPNNQWIDFSDGAKGLKPIAPEVTPILPKETPLSVHISINEPGKHLLLFNRGLKIIATKETQQEVMTKFLIAPSQAFAPNPQLTEASILMPQKGSMAANINKKFEFDAASTDEHFILEEYIAIVVDRELDLDWLRPNHSNPMPVWNGKHLEQLWNQLQEQNTKVFHREFEIQEARRPVA